MESEKLQELLETINEGLVAFRHISRRLHMKKAMLPSLEAQIDANETKAERAMRALEELKKELGM